MVGDETFQTRTPWPASIRQPDILCNACFRRSLIENLEGVLCRNTRQMLLSQRLGSQVNSFAPNSKFGQKKTKGAWIILPNRGGRTEY